MLEGYAWDVCGRVMDYGDDTGSIDLWDTTGSSAVPTFYGTVSFRNGQGACGRMVMENGWMFSYGEWIGAYDSVEPLELTKDCWDVDPNFSSVSHFGDMIEITGYYEDSDGNGFDYCIYLRPWGTTWEDVYYGDTSGCIFDDMMPLYYDSWYLPLLELGYMEPPDSYGEGVSILENN